MQSAPAKNSLSSFTGLLRCSLFLLSTLVLAFLLSGALFPKAGFAQDDPGVPGGGVGQFPSYSIQGTRTVGIYPNGGPASIIVSGSGSLYWNYPANNATPYGYNELYLHYYMTDNNVTVFDNGTPGVLISKNPLSPTVFSISSAYNIMTPGYHVIHYVGEFKQVHNHPWDAAPISNIGFYSWDMYYYVTIP